MSHSIRTFSIVVVSALLISCGGGGLTDSQGDDGTKPPAGKLSQHVIELAFGQTATIPSDNISLTFESVLQDSRCPSDSNIACFWEGQAIIGVSVRLASGDPHLINLTVYGGCAEGCFPYTPALDTLGYRFQLVALNPYPVSTDPIPDEDYIATIALFPYPPMDSVDGEVIISNVPPSGLQKAPFLLDEVGIAGDVLTLAVEYGGGCADHTFELHMTPAAFMESLPVQANLYLSHADYDDPCDAWIRGSISFDLRPIAQMYEVQYGQLDCIMLNVYGYLNGSDPGTPKTVIYRPDGTPVTSLCSERDL